MTSVQEQFSRAFNAIKNGELENARELLLPLIKHPALKADAQHSLAVVERKLGNLDRAAYHFEAVIAGKAANPHVYNNYANCLRDQGQDSKAIDNYQQALRLKPDYLDAIINLAMHLKNLGRLDEAEEHLRTGLKTCGDNVRILHGLGTVLRDAGRLDEAAEVLDQALGSSQRSVQLLHLRALVEAERGKPALPYYRMAMGVAPENPELQLGFAVAQLESGDGDAALNSLQELTAKFPLWVQGHSALAQLRWQLGYGERFVDSFESALADYPVEPDLYIGYFATLMRAGKYQTVLDHLEQARPALSDAMLNRYEAACASETGDIPRADRLFGQLAVADDVELEIARVRHLLRSHRPGEAAANAERLAQQLDVMAAWPYLSIAWRLTRDPRSQWLDGDGTLLRVIDLPDLQAELGSIADKLRSIHYGKEHPFDQSMRGGSQTDGNLFLRSDPELRRLRALIERGASEYLAGLPPRDPRHPFLRHPRNQVRFLASYSVRLLSSGFHINHMHPEAAVSCCFYVDTPASIGVSEDQPAGWLSIGMPPVELGIELPPLARVRPQPGRLALFPSIMWHGTYPFPQGERLTVVSDLTLI